MKAILKTMLILIGIVISFKYAYAVDCNAIPGGCDNCDPWQINERFGNTLVIPTGDPTCYFVVDFLTRTCYCDGYIKREIKINGIRKEGSNCANVTDREVFTKIYTFLLFISRDLFGVDYPTFEVGIMTPACYQWVGSTLVDCGSGCCRKSWVVTYNGRRVEVSSGGVENVACSGAVGGGCQNLCDSLDVLDGALYYPSWPSMCLDQDPCRDSPWQFNPYENYIIADVQGCRVIAYYEEADCPGLWMKFRLKFIQLGPYCGNVRMGEIITNVVKRILARISARGGNEFFDLVTYHCWTTVTGNGYTRISPCENSDECCLIEYDIPYPTIRSKNLVFDPGTTCPTNCYPECDTLVSDTTTQLPPPRIAFDKQDIRPIESETLSLRYEEAQDWIEVILDGSHSEDVTLEVYNLIGAKIYRTQPNTRLTNSTHFIVPKTTQGVFILVLRKDGEILSRELKVFIK